MSFHYRHRKIILICTLFLAFVSGGVFFLIKKNMNKKETSNKRNNIIISKKKDTTSSKINDEKKIYKVDIKGEVFYQGIYELEEGNRVIDVINKAGGLTENADTSVLNLSKKIKDEMVIIVYSKNEVSDFKKTKEEEKVLQEKCIKKDDNSLTNDACIDSNNNSSTTLETKININSASREELLLLPKIGEAKAENIINYRKTNGDFKSIEEIKNVDGIGESLYAQIEEYITIE